MLWLQQIGIKIVDVLTVNYKHVTCYAGDSGHYDYDSVFSQDWDKFICSGGAATLPDINSRAQLH